MPSINLQLPIEVGDFDYEKQTWPINDTSAFYASVTSPLNTSSNQTVLYAHNKNNLFGKVKGLETGDSIVITDNVNQKYTYTLSSRKIVKPTDTAVFYEKPSSPDVYKRQVFDVIATQPDDRSFSSKYRAIVAESSLVLMIRLTPCSAVSVFLLRLISSASGYCGKLADR